MIYGAIGTFFYNHLCSVIVEKDNEQTLTDTLSNLAAAGAMQSDDIIADLRQSSIIGSHRKNFIGGRKHRSCFRGSAAVKWLTNQRNISTGQAVDIFDRLFRDGDIVVVSENPHMFDGFKNESTVLYRCKGMDALLEFAKIYPQRT